MWKLFDSTRESFLTELEITDNEYNQLPEHKKDLYRRIGEKTKLIEEKPIITHYGILYEDSCHMGEWCGRSGLGCMNSNCPLL
jgi:hypothetical protein